MLVCGLLAACSDKSSNTKIMVEVWTDLAIPSALDSIRIDVSGSSPSPSTTFPLTLANGNGTFNHPVVMALASPDNQAVAFQVSVSGLLGNKVVVARAVRSSFDPGRTRVLGIFLDGTCKDVTSGPCTQPLDVDVQTLPLYDPTKPGLSWLDGGVDGRGAVDGNGSEAGVVVVADARPSGDGTPEGSVADAPWNGDLVDGPSAWSDVGPQPTTDLPVYHDAAPDAPLSPDVLDLPDVVPDLLVVPDAVVILDTTSSCGPSSDGGDACRQPDDLGADGLVLLLDAGPDAPVDTPADVAGSPDTPRDVGGRDDLVPDLAPPDGPAPCVPPMINCTSGCIDPRTSLGNCGGCGQACSTQNGTPTCAASACSMAACSPGFLNCSANEDTSRNGCETNGNTDSANCGHCGNACSSRVCRNQICLATARYGNTGPGIDISSFAKGYLAGIQVHIPNAAAVTGFGAVFYDGTASCSMYLGLYTDITGNPGELVATVNAPAVVGPGGKEMSVALPIDIPLGTYWILGVWNDLASFATNNVTTTVTWRYVSYPYGPLPATAPPSMTALSLPPPNVYVIVAQ
jgi:hypothetical protein